MGTVIGIMVKVRNLTFTDITSMTAYDIDSFDFGSELRPDKVFNGSSLSAGSTLEKKIYINPIASNCPFALRLKFRNGREDDIKINSKCAYDSTSANLRHFSGPHNISYHGGQYVLEIIIKNTQSQIDNHKAEQLNREGCALMKAKKFQEASVKFVEASRKATESQTKTSIQKNRDELEKAKRNEIDKKSLKLKEEGLALLHENKFQQALNKFDEAIKATNSKELIRTIERDISTAKAKMHQDAKKFNQAGLTLRNNNQLNEAVKKFDQALEIANDKALIDSINKNKAETLVQMAKALVEEGWAAEMSPVSENNNEGPQKFVAAKNLFQEAYSIESNPDYQKSIEIIDLKVEGNKYFRFARQLDDEGAYIVEDFTCDCKVAIAKYGEAYEQYEKAKKKYEEGLEKGDQKFEFSVNITNVALKGIRKIVDELEKADVEKDLQTSGFTEELEF